MAAGGVAKDEPDLWTLIRRYERYVHANLDDEHNLETEALLTLILRDVLEDRWGEMGERERRRVRELDEVLASKHERVAWILPDPVEQDRRRWWWFLHEGPEVRGHALARGDGAPREG